MTDNRNCAKSIESFYENDNTRVTIFFNENRFSVEKEELAKEIGSLFMLGLITYSDINGSEYGRIVLETNPTRTSGTDVTMAAKRMIDFIKETDQAAERS